MSTVANLLVRLAADFGDAPQKVRDLHDGIDDLGHSAEEAGGHVDDLGRHAHDSGEGFGDLAEKLGEFGEELLSVALEAVELTGVLEVLKESLEVSAEIESVTVALAQFAGGVAEAREEIEQLEEVAKSEALKFPEVLPAAQHFMALGFSAEQTTRAIEVAGNAAWALGSSVESVTQRMGMMTMGGQVSGRFLRSLGISLEDLGRVMGITGKDAADLEDKVRRAFKFEDEADRLEALTAAMDKFGGLGAKEADTLSGKWIEMKNSFHEAFAAIGDDLLPVAKMLVDIGTQIANVIALLGKLPHSMVPAFAGEDHPNGVPNTGDASTGWTGGAKGDKGGYGVKTTNPKPGAGGPQDAAAKALAESNAAQEYARNKTRIDSQAASAKAMVELWRSAYATLAATHQVSYAEQLEQDRNFNADELKITLDAIGKKKALQTSTKGLKEEDKDATLDAQAQTAREKYAAANAALESKEIERQDKFVTEVVKKGEERVIKEHDLQKRMLSQLESFTFGQEDQWRKQIEDEENAAQAMEEARAKSDSAGRRTTDAGLGQSIKASQMALERTYSLEYTHTLAQQVAYQRQLGELEAQSLDVKAREAAATAEESKKLADMAAANAAGVEDEDLKRKAIEASAKAQDDALSAAEAQNAAANQRYETETKIAQLIKQQSIGGKLEASFNQSFGSIPGALGGAVAAGVTHQGKGGMDIGKQIEGAMRNIGKTLLGDALKAAIDKMVVATGLNTLAQHIHTAAIFTHLGAMLAHMGVMIAHMGVMVANTIGVLANTIATVLNTLWTVILATVETVKAFFGFDTGGPVPHDMVAQVHGGEHVLTGAQVQGLAPMPDLPAFRTGNGLHSAGKTVSSSSSASSSMGDVHIHVNGAQNPRDTAREVAQTMKQLSPTFAAASVPYSK